ncbi:MAG: ATP-binding cassette domain-containing protein, partial [Myxococcota bacterium]|nr:ATP-binding cassette domain-containing protein [Myxococcota bacterium]
NRQKALKRELEWVRSSQKARQAKGKARLNSYEALLQEAPSERLQAGTIWIPPGQRLGNTVIKGSGLSKSYGDRVLFDGLDFDIPAGATVGVIGANGVGKTTLCRIITGYEEPDGGQVEVVETVDLAYVDQSRDALGGERTVWEEISNGAEVIELGRREVSSRAYCSWFNFKGDSQQQRVGELSGGERNRVHMAKLLKSGGNVLILDEPTNDLDVDTLRSLEDALAEFGGCSIIISHDRWFLDRLATHILAFEGDSQVEWFQGNFADYEADRKRRLGEDAGIPKRPKFRRLASMG